MKRALGVLVLLCVPAMFALVPACSAKGGGDIAPALVNCTPGNNVVCKCKNGDFGTHECLRDGHTFGTCEPCFGDLEDTGPLPPEDTDPPVEETSRGGDTGANETAVADSDATPVEAGAGDVCPGTPVKVDPGKKVELTGDTSKGAIDHYGAGGDCSSGYLGKAIAYEVSPSAAGTLTATIVPSLSFDAIVYAAKSNCATGSVVGCVGGKGAGAITSTSFHVDGASKYYVFVEGKSGGTGAYTLRLDLASPFCGDGTVDPGEDCDDGNTIADDGCDTMCHVRGNPLTAGKCPGLPVNVWSTASTVVVTGSTKPYKNGYKGTCGGDTAPERPYAITPHLSGKLTAFLDPAGTDYDAVIYARTTPCGTGPELKCSDVPGLGGDSVTFAVTSGTTYYVFVDGYLGASGSLKMNLSLTSP